MNVEEKLQEAKKAISKASASMQMGKTEDAEKFMLEHYSIMKEVYEHENDDRTKAGLAAAIGQLCMLYDNLEDHKMIVKYASSGSKISKELYDDYNDSERFAIGYMTMLFQTIFAYLDLDDYENAKIYFKEAQQLSKEVLARFPDNDHLENMIEQCDKLNDILG